MTAEDVARFNQFRDGFTLVDYAEVGLPVFRLTIEALTTSERAIPAIQEFTMRCLALGETYEQDIAQVLGLSPEIVEGAMNVLVGEGSAVRLAGRSDPSAFRLSEVGEQRLEAEREEVVHEEMIVVDYDGITRAPIRLAGESVVRASDLKAFGAVEIRPYPAEPPAVTDLSIPEVSRAIRRQSGEDFHRNVLALKRIVRRTNVFREAVALVFASDRGDEVQVAFAINGRISEAHERAFALNGGPKKMGFVRSIASDSSRKLNRFLGRDILVELADDQRLSSIREEQAAALAEAEALRPAAELAGARSSAGRAFATARERVSLVEHELARLPLRTLACYEQHELLAEAIKNTAKSLIITSAGLQPTILSQHTLRDIDRLLSSRISIRIGTFLEPQREPRGKTYFDPLAELTRRSARSSIDLIETRRSNFFFLVQDDQLAVVSSQPFFGDVVRRSGFSRVQGVVARKPAIVEQIRELAMVATRPKKGA
jgi:hypothetical protein